MERSNSAATASVLLSTDLNVFRALEAHGLNAAAVFRCAGCDPRLRHVPETRVSNRVKQRLFEVAEQETGDPCFGIEVGKQARGVALHALGYAWPASTTLGEAPYPSLLCRREDLGRPLATANPGVASASDQLMTEYLARLDHDDIAARVKCERLGRFPTGAPTQATIARARDEHAHVAPAARGARDFVRGRAGRDALRSRHGVLAPQRLLGG
jgi:Arabinose-binding domain of AraC transcription regulator, N-term